ncbi:MAG TPA: HAD-IIIA family hydrolase [Chromatiales bacterium]|nr:HAD-IIIA family hydrolase [Thiotrichales bacterium]HIP67508.1 HAD-IIIA family hydrolase [Chromatiales bacterium]
MKNKFEVLVFDWDGTLMDSEAHIVACMDYAIRENGIEPDPPHQLKRVIGLGLNEAVAELLPDHQNTTHLQIAETYRHRFLSDEKSQSDLFPDVESTLRKLHSAGYLLTVATGKSRRGLDKVLAQTGLEDLFVATRCADETFSKPHPQMLDEIKTDLDVRAENMLMIGDTAFDLQMAVNAGVPSVGVSYGVHEPERLLEHEPLAILDCMSELPDWLISPDE